MKEQTEAQKMLEKETIELKNFYKEEKKRIQSRKKVLKQQSKVEKEPLWTRFTKQVDRARLSVYQLFEEKAADLRYKVENYDHWEADQVVQDAKKTLVTLQKRINNKKKLTHKHAEKALLYKLALQVTYNKKLGYYSEEELTTLLNAYSEVWLKISKELPLEDQEVRQGISKVLNGILAE